jgi:hypothetical protein
LRLKNFTEEFLFLENRLQSIQALGIVANELLA